MRGHEGRKLAIEAEAADWQPRCLWECSLLPAPSPEDCLPAPPHEANCGKPRQRKFPGKYFVYTDASAMRPNDPYLRSPKEGSLRLLGGGLQLGLGGLVPPGSGPDRLPR